MTEDKENKISEQDKKKVQSAVSDVEKWIEDNPTADADQFEAKHNELQSIAHPIFGKMYGGAGGAAPDPGSFNMPNFNSGAPGGGDAGAGGNYSGPTVEEID